MVSQLNTKTLQAKIKRLEVEQRWLERQLKILQQQLAVQLSNSKCVDRDTPVSSK